MNLENLPRDPNFPTCQPGENPRSRVTRPSFPILQMGQLSPSGEPWLSHMASSAGLLPPKPAPGVGVQHGRGQRMGAAWLMGGPAGQARRRRVLGGRGGPSGRAGWGPAPYRKLSSASARGPGQFESGSHSGSASGSTWDSGWGSGSGSSWGSRGLSQEMVEEVFTSFRVELEGQGK